MNRHQRRGDEKKRAAEIPPSGQPAPPQQALPVMQDAGKPSLALRCLARIILSRFVLKRINHPHVLFMLAEVARQARRLDAAAFIQTKLPPAQ